MSTQWMKQTLIASVLTGLMTLPALAQQRRTAAPAPGGPAKPAAGLPFEFKAATRQAAQKAQEAYKALLKARVTHLKATKALLVALKGDSEKGTQGKQSSPVKAVTSKGKGSSSHPITGSGRPSSQNTQSGHAGTEHTQRTSIPAGVGGEPTQGAPILAEVKEILGAVGFYSGGFDSTGGFSYGKPEGNAKQAGIGRSNKVSFEDHFPKMGDFDFNDVILKLDTQIRNVQNVLLKIPYDKIRH